jgi:hypothetical protein
LIRALLILLPACALLSGSLVRHSRGKTVGSLLQLVGAASFVLVVLTHIFEALHWLPSMGRGRERSPGHYLDLTAAVLGVTLFPLGYLLGAVERQVPSGGR